MFSHKTVCNHGAQIIIKLLIDTKIRLPRNFSDTGKCFDTYFVFCFMSFFKSSWLLSHNDYFTLFYDLTNLTRPISISYVAPSVTTYSYLNPAYRIYTVDGYYPGSSFQVLNHETIYLNLTEANLTNKPQWRLEYNTKVWIYFLFAAFFIFNWIMFAKLLRKHSTWTVRFHRIGATWLNKVLMIRKAQYSKNSTGKN